jgi:hypothetical protein
MKMVSVMLGKKLPTGSIELLDLVGKIIKRSDIDAVITQDRRTPRDKFVAGHFI